MSRKYLGKIPTPEHLGRTIGRSRLYQVVLETYQRGRGTPQLHSVDARRSVRSVSKDIRSFIEAEKLKGRHIPEELIISILVDAIRDFAPLSRWEKTQRQELKAEIGKTPQPTPGRAWRVRFLNELIETLMHFGNKVESPAKIEFLSLTEASELAATWLVKLGILVGQTSVRPPQVADRTKSQLRAGIQIARAAESMRQSFRRSKSTS